LARTLAASEDVPRELGNSFWWEVARYERDVRGELQGAEAALGRALAHRPNDVEVLTALASVQQRMPGRALIETLVRLSEARGGDLTRVRAASEVALHDLGDRRLATELLEKLLELSVERWTNVDVDKTDTGGPDPRDVATWSLERLVRLAHEDGRPSRVV